MQRENNSLEGYTPAKMAAVAAFSFAPFARSVFPSNPFSSCATNKFTPRMLPISEKWRNFAASRIRETGENPVQSRCCEFHHHRLNVATDALRHERLWEGEPSGNKPENLP